MVIMKARKIKKPFKSQKFPRKSEVSERDVLKEKSEREKVPKEIRIIAQEVQMVRSLACNDLNKRNRQIRKLRKWLQLRARSSFPLTEEDFLRIWKGLYYNMWMSDKPLVQEDLAEQLGKLIECFDGDVTTSVNFFGGFMQTMCNEWFGIDQWRIDKFMMLVRRMLRYMFRVLKRDGWTKDSIKLFNDHMKLTVLADESPAIGLTMHYLDIFFEELAKVSEGDISAEQVGDFVRPFVTYLGKGRDAKLVSHCRSRVLTHLLYQSALGREYTEKFNAWKEMGFPTASINDLEKAEEDIEENVVDSAVEGEVEDDGTEVEQNEQHLDPRAGNVDVFMPELPLDGKYVIDELERLLYKDEDISTKVRKSLRKQLSIFQSYQSGKFPLGVKRMPRFKARKEKPLMKDKIEQLLNVENELFGVGRKLKQLNKRKRRKLLNSLNFEEVDESNFDQTILKAIPKQYLAKGKRKATSTLNDWVEEEIGAEDLLPRKKQKRKIVEKAAKQNTNTKEHKQRKDQETKELKATSLSNKKTQRVDAQATPTVQQNQDKTEDKPNQDKETPATEAKSEWDTPLAEAKKLANKTSTPVSAKKGGSINKTPSTGSVKRVKIALKHNTAQNPSEYIKQIKSSPSLPYDAHKKPGKGLLKPNSMPSPINPFYKRKIGLRLANDTI